VPREARHTSKSRFNAYRTYMKTATRHLMEPSFVICGV
jgi:hypothetical protein